MVEKVFQEGYFGGKEASGTWQKIINEVRPHDVFVSPFLGNCALARHIRKAKKMIGIDLDPQVIQAWREMAFDGSPRDWIGLIQGNGIDMLSQLPAMFTGERLFVYCDPPYRISSRSQPVARYLCEMTDEDHERFLREIISLSRCPNVDVLISHYPDPVYDQTLKDWRKVSFQSKTRRGMATENLYANYEHTTGELHDYRYIGDNKDERYNLKHRTAKNLIGKLAGMDPRKRRAVLHYLLAWFDESDPTS